MDDKTNRSDYLAMFSGNTTEDKSKQAEALRQALDIRKFEIDLYWKRATYFWTIIAAAFAGYFLVQKADGTPQFSRFEPSFIISCIGSVFSLGWYFANRGSKTWQLNWETHVDLLEDEVMGPLYKTVMDRGKNRFWHLFNPYQFSVSRINQILSLFVFFIWLLLVFSSLNLADTSIFTHRFTLYSVSSLSILAMFILFFCGKTELPDEEVQFSARTRRYRERPNQAL